MRGAVGTWFLSLVRLLFPCRCVVCANSLREGEEGICIRCNMDMPRTGYHLQADNPVESLLRERMAPERASSFFYYHKGSGFCDILHKLKYGGRKDLAEIMGRFMAAELMAAGYFSDVDIIVPVPLHHRKQRQRGYNQSRYVACGISAVTGIPADTSSVVRKRATETQTHKSAYERWENMDGAFFLHSPECFVGKHVLIVDDVLTTGATLIACADVFKEVEGVRISFLTLAVADS